MEGAIRWSTRTNREPRFLIVDTAGREVRLCEPFAISGKSIEYKNITQINKLPEFGAFDWSRADENLVALGTVHGEARILQLDASNSSNSYTHSFPIKQTRECNSIAFNNNNLLASALKKHRTDSSLNIYDIGAPSSGNEPYRRFANGDAVANVKFFPDRPNTLLAGITTKGLRLYDLRDSNSAGPSFIPTRQCHFLGIDPLDENYFAAAGPTGENTVCLWDRRAFDSANMGNMSTASSSNAVLEIPDVIDGRRQSTIRGLRFSGIVRGRFAILSSAGQLRQFDVAQSRPSVQGDAYHSNDVDHDIGDSFHYLKKSNNLQYSWFHGHFGQEESTAMSGFDWTNPGSLANTPGILQLRRNGNVEFMAIPTVPSIVKFTPRNEVAFHIRSTHVTRLVQTHATIAEELIQFQENVQKQLADSVAQQSDAALVNKEQIDVLGEADRVSWRIDKPLSSQQEHERLLDLGLTTTRPDIMGMLTVLDTQRRRCEEGYLFDCDLNKSIVKNDPWLVDMWEFIKHLKDMAEDGEMIGGAGLDLSLIGVYNIWTANIGPSSKRLALRQSVTTADFDMAVKDVVSRRLLVQYNGITTDFPHRRQLSLIMCGWRFNEKRLRTKCVEILERREHYKAIVVAFCHGNKELAIDMLKSATRIGAIDNSGLAAVIACDSVSKEQRSLCEWMAEDAKDPYLRALLTYFTTGDWKSVIQMVELPLMYRLAIALQYLDDAQLDRFIRNTTGESVRTGDIEGLVLTGLTEDSMELFQSYIDKTNDIQTAVLATAFSNPRYNDTDRWSIWKDNYFDRMQSWRAFAERTRFTIQHSRMSVDRTGQKLVRPPPRQLTLRCNHCQKSIAKVDDQQKQAFSAAVAHKLGAQPNRPQNPGMAAGTVCPRCGRHLPRCSLCMLWLGTPDSAAAAVAAPLKPEDQMAMFINFCVHCGHGYHANHGREWFAKHQICPVPSCKCMCALRRA